MTVYQASGYRMGLYLYIGNPTKTDKQQLVEPVISMTGKNEALFASDPRSVVRATRSIKAFIMPKRDF